LGGRLDGCARGERLDGRAEPACVRPLAGQSSLDVAVLLDTRRRIDDEHLTGPEPAAPDAGALGEREGARFRGAGDEPVADDRVAQGTQAVPVEGGTDDAPVREDDAGGTIPRLEEGGVVAVEAANVLVQLWVGVVCLR